MKTDKQEPAPDLPAKSSEHLTLTNSRPPEVPAIYFDGYSMNFFVQAPTGEFIRHRDADLRLLLRGTGMSSLREDDQNSEIDDFLIDLRLSQFVEYAGPLAGFDVGRYDIEGVKVLVTKPPIIIEATYGENLILKEYVDCLLGEKAVYAHAWLKTARESLLAGDLRRGPVLTLVGPRDHGKSLFVQAIVVPILGGRQARPQRFMTGASTFNADLFGAEVLVMDDPGSDENYSARKRFGDAIKQFTGDQAPSCHAKGKNAFTLTPFWRMMVVMNDELEDIQALPPMTKSMLDKIIILKTVQRAVKVKTGASGAYQRYCQTLREGVGDYLGWLENWTIPAELVSDRWGIKAWQHPEVMLQLRSFNPEERLREFLRTEIATEAANGGIEMIMDSHEIYQALTDPLSNVAHASRALLKSPGSVGRYMSRLCDHHPNEFRQAGGGHANVTLWAILPKQPVVKPAQAASGVVQP